MEFVALFIITTIKILKYAILIRILMSWIKPGVSGRFTQILYEVTEPILKVFRNLLPRMGMIDLSPIIAFFVLDFAQIGIINIFASI